MDAEALPQEELSESSYEVWETDGSSSDFDSEDQESSDEEYGDQDASSRRRKQAALS